MENVIIIGSGPAGLSAAIYCAREGFSPLVVAGSVPGGQLLLTTTVENMPGFPEGIEGPALIELLRKQAEKFGARFIQEDAKDVDFASRPFKVYTESGLYEAKTIIIATGANPKMLGISSESKFVGKGLSTCATCDGPLFKNSKNLVVVGGGDTAMEDSLFLTRFSESVTIVHRRDSFRASKVMQERVLNNKKIKVEWNSVVEEILGDEHVKGVRIRNVASGQTKDIDANGVFLAIGHEPNTKIFKGKLDLDEEGYIITKEEVLTGIEGVFVAGDVADKKYRQAGTAAGSGIKAALMVREYFQKEAKMGP
ncbi:MAG: thioredoxin-disulfide reductase [Candidatus Micrarchaeaceae archaeon]